MIDVSSRLNWRLSLVKSVESFFSQKFHSELLSDPEKTIIEN